MIRTFFRHVLESIKSLRRNGWMTISSISAVAITLTLLGIFLTIILNTVKLAEDMEITLKCRSLFLMEQPKKNKMN